MLPPPPPQTQLSTSGGSVLAPSPTPSHPQEERCEQNQSWPVSPGATVAAAGMSWAAPQGPQTRPPLPAPAGAPDPARTHRGAGWSPPPLREKKVTHVGSTPGPPEQSQPPPAQGLHPAQRFPEVCKVLFVERLIKH